MKLTTFKRPLIIAHRGYRTKYPENTLAAFDAALDIGVQMIELDIMLTRDRKMVVIHDATLERTTDGHGQVNSYTLQELKELDAGNRFHPRFAGERLLELEEVLDLVRGRTLVNIEIKASAYEAHQPHDAIEKQVVELVRRKNALTSVLISSFEWKILENVASMEDAPAIALISKYPAEGDNVKLCIRLKAFSWHPNCLELNYELVKMMHESSIRVFPYNVDTPEEYQRMINMDVDGVITSDPAMVP
ncbi:MAG: glycerophosphodiester phosphodiesterase, partial [Deltaproteobacteria bacterium]|nr:glycerophosphodiester phosphodiesterase [Deltaproteobacteria bacterium]